MKKIGFIFLLCFSVNFCKAQYEGEIVGKIIDSISHENLIGANISLEQDGNITDQTTANNNGAFYFKHVLPGDYELKITYLGYIDGYYLIDVTANNNTFIAIEMQQGTNELQGYVVKAAKDERKIIHDIPIIKAADLDHMAAETAAQAVVQTVPGVYNQDGGDKGGLFIQGSREDATLYVIDGVKVYGSAFVPKNAIAEITVYTSGMPAKYGDVTGGVIEIRTKGFSGIY